MSSSNADLTYLRDILHSSELISQYTAEIDLESFIRETKIRDAVNWQLLVIGEAVKRLSEELKASYPDVAWKEVKGMRNVVAHEYDELIYEEIWRTLQTDLPEFEEQVRKIFQKLS